MKLPVPPQALPPVRAFAVLCALLGQVVFSSALAAAPAPAETLVANILVGGGMRSCTSTSGDSNCSKPWPQILQEDPGLQGLAPEQLLRTPSLAVPTFSYRLDAPALAALEALPASLLPADTKAALLQRLRAALRASGPRTGMARPELEALALAPGTSLTPTAQAALLHSLVEPLPALPGGRPIQARSLAFLTDAATRDIYREMVQAAAARAGGRKPLIGIVTASSRNPFNDRDIYHYAFQSAGAEVLWLPLDGALRRAIDQGECAYLPVHASAYANQGMPTSAPLLHLDQRFPDLAALQLSHCAGQGALLNAALARLDGIFFSGGDQARLIDALLSPDAQGRPTLPSPQLRLLQQRFAAGSLVVAGSSAGNAAQAGGQWRGKAVPMISGGDSLQTLARGFSSNLGPTVEGASRSGTLYAEGGLGFFEYGALDSHFSQRGREGRLLRLVTDSGMDYGFGVDENTALVVYRRDPHGRARMRVVGQGGVFIVDARHARTESVAAGAYAAAGVRLHYLMEGDQAAIDATGALSVQLDPARPVLPATEAGVVPWGRVQQPGSLGFVRLTRAMGHTGAAQGLGSTDGASPAPAGATPAALQTGPSKEVDGPHFSLRLHRGPTTEFRGGKDAGVSYRDLLIDVQPCAGACSLLP